jgi:hypothetical protein
MYEPKELGFAPQPSKIQQFLQNKIYFFCFPRKPPIVHRKGENSPNKWSLQRPRVLKVKMLSNKKKMALKR